MALRILDTNVLIDLWKGRIPEFKRVTDGKSAMSAAQEWMNPNPNDAIVTPVKLEFLGGALSKDEMKITDLFLGQFDIVDEGKILDEDWIEAERLARRIPFEPSPRGMVDCLIRAIANRFNCAVKTSDLTMPPK